MIRAWRIVQKSLAATAFDGQGARRFGGRWNSRGRGMIYTSGSLALAAMEVLAHLESTRVLSRRYCFIQVDIPEEVCMTLPARRLRKGWDADPSPDAARETGDAWLDALESAVLAVPSALVRQELNYLLNPAHPDFRKIKVRRAQPFAFSPRLIKEKLS